MIHPLPARAVQPTDRTEDYWWPPAFISRPAWGWSRGNGEYFQQMEKNWGIGSVFC
jgi:hypothetical protein